ncbi:MAG: hypothetical protein AB1411_12385 [Nitrospirota bacterium]
MAWGIIMTVLTLAAMLFLFVVDSIVESAVHMPEEEPEKQEGQPSTRKAA